jgi:ABC-type multidrug transport system fused ATPase/permease subunit
MNLINTVLMDQKKIISKLEDRIKYLTRKSEKFSSVRLIVFATGVVLSITGYIISKEIGWILTILSLIGFGITVHLHNILIQGIRKTFTYKKIKEENLARMNVDWNNIPDPINNNPPSEMSAERDLDLTGKYSLHNLLDTAVSVEGSSLLRKWISGADPDRNVILDRQKIVQELSGLSRFRDRFILKARLVSRKVLECQKLVDWLNNSEKVVLPERLLYITSALIFTYIVLFVLNMLGYLPQLWIMVLVIYFFVYISNQKKISKIVEDSSELESQLKKFSALVILTGQYSFVKQPHLNGFLSVFRKGDQSAAHELKDLQSTISALLVRSNPLIGLVLNILMPYDIYFCRKLIKIKNNIRENIISWSEKLNELECYISLANFANLNPGYTFPELNDGNEISLDLKEIGHPLLSPDKKVCNDFSFDKQNEIVIITGSNMSGKSTFLRSVGINLCLAYAGAPVNAGKFGAPLYDLFTCIKVNDSVVDGISYFYAEVKKLKTLLDKFDRASEQNNINELKKFFLIDEIFKGTNNKERLTGSKAFVKELARKGATGFVTTHDLELINLEKEIPVIENYHFREEIVNDKMEFDYRIHKGPCPTTNALKIMKLSGLPVE